MSETPSSSRTAPPQNHLPVTQIFGTPICTVKPKSATPLFNTRLKELILAKESSSDGVPRSNIHGWQSGRDLLQWEGSETETLFNMFLYGFGQMTAALLKLPAEDLDARFELSAWANVSRKGAYHVSHSHMGSTWSAVYYVTSGDMPDEDTDPSGTIQFEDPRPGIYMPGLTEEYVRPLCITPEAGLLIVFPSWLPHFVHPYQGEQERISIACNARLLEKTRR